MLTYKDLNNQDDKTSIKISIVRNHYPAQPHEIPYAYHPPKFLQDLNFINQSFFNNRCIFSQHRILKEFYNL